MMHRINPIIGFSFFYYHIKYHILNMLDIKYAIKSARVEKKLTSSETQLQVSEN